MLIYLLYVIFLFSFYIYLLCVSGERYIPGESCTLKILSKARIFPVPNMYMDSRKPLHIFSPVKNRIFWITIYFWNTLEASKPVYAIYSGEKHRFLILSSEYSTQHYTQKTTVFWGAEYLDDSLRYFWDLMGHVLIFASFHFRGLFFFPPTSHCEAEMV